MKNTNAKNDPATNARAVAETVAIYQSMLLADRSAMDHLLDAIRKIQAHSAELVKKA